MIILFCGSFFYHEKEKDKETILTLLNEKIGDHPAQLYFCSCGEFDEFAVACAKLYQSTHPETKLIFISPTPVTAHDFKAHRLELKNALFDEILCPNTNKIPHELALFFRDKWIVEQTDLIIAHIPDIGGDAYKLCQHAMRKHKTIINIAKENKLFY